MDFKLAVKLLTEFDYEKNGKENTISFLAYMLNTLINNEEK